MSSSVNNSSGSKSLISGQNVFYAGITWGIVSLLFFLLFGASVPGEESPLWYLIGTYFFELTPFLVAALLCFRNFRSPQIASGRNVWLGIGIAMICYFLGGILFGWWELYWSLDPDVSPADFFYMGFYVAIGWAMLLAVLPRRLNLELWQWGSVGAIAIVAILLAVIVTLAANNVAQETETIAPVAEEQVITEVQPGVTTTAVTSSPAPNAPGWVIATENTLSQVSTPVNFFYVIGDVFLLILAATLLLAFWGGRFSQSWRMIAAAALSLYIADMWFKYSATLPVGYESGSLLEVFFVFSGVLFAIGAALEYDISSRSRRSNRRRTG